MAVRLLATCLLLALASGEADARKDQSDEPKPCAVTVYIDADLGSRKKGAAKRINESHAEQQARGYIFVDLEIYIEDGDMEGFFVTYAKPDCALPDVAETN